MRASKVIQIASKGLTKNKLRSLLTMLGIIIGVAENLSVAFISPGYKDFISFALIILMLLFRRKGIFGVLGGVR